MAATMKDLSRETGLGLATLSKYFNGGTVREKNRLLIEAAVKKLHYVPNEVARSLKTKHSRVIGVVIPRVEQRLHHFDHFRYGGRPAQAGLRRHRLRLPERSEA